MRSAFTCMIDHTRREPEKPKPKGRPYLFRALVSFVGPESAPGKNDASYYSADPHLSYQIRPGNTRLAALVDLWLEEGKVEILSWREEDEPPP